MKAMLFTQKKQRELFEKVYQAGEDFMNAEDRDEHFSLGERYGGMYDLLIELGLDEAYEKWQMKTYPRELDFSDYFRYHSAFANA